MYIVISLLFLMLLVISINKYIDMSTPTETFLCRMRIPRKLISLSLYAAEPTCTYTDYKQ